MFRRMRRAEWIWISLFSLALGMAISINMGVQYNGIRDSILQNYLSINLSVIARGILLAVPVFLFATLVNDRAQKTAWVQSFNCDKRISNRKFFVMIWILLVICWLPWLLTFYPGGIVGDGAEALEYVLNDSTPISGRWVVSYILLLRLFSELGSLFSADINFGVFLYASFSLLLYSAACAAVITELRKKGVPALLLCLFFLLYAVTGHYVSYSMALWKDGLFGAGILMLSLLLWNDHRLKQKKWKIQVGVICFFLCIWRNSVSYAVLLTGLGMICLSGKKWGGLGKILMIVSLSSIIIQMLMNSFLGVIPAPISESMAIPIQQIAAVINCGGELTVDQSSFLFSLLSEEEWKTLYTPTLCDPVKFAMENELSGSAIFHFYWIWFQLLLKYPNIYIKAHLMETLGFWQPYGSYQGFYFDWYLGVEDLYNRGFHSRDLILSLTGISLESELFGRMRFISSGTTVWIMLFSLTMTLCQRRKKQQRLKAILPFPICWMIVFFSAPIAYSFRYIEMVAMGLPLFVSLPFIREGVEPSEKEEQRAPNSKARYAKFRQILTSGRLAVILGCVIILSLGIQLALGSEKVEWFENGRLTIWTSGENNNSKYYITEGLSANEGAFTWTEGDSLKVHFSRRNGIDKGLNVVLHVSGTFNGDQRVEVNNQVGELIGSTILNGAGDYVFSLNAEGQKEIAFQLRFPDAAVVSDVIENADDHRKISLQLTSIELFEQ